MSSVLKLWERKVSDLAFREFFQILDWVAQKKGKKVIYIDQWYPSTKTCSHCHHLLDSLDLSIREWRCPSCQAISSALFFGWLLAASFPLSA